MGRTILIIILYATPLFVCFLENMKRKNVNKKHFDYIENSGGSNNLNLFVFSKQYIWTIDYI